METRVAKNNKSSTMTAEHKKALAEGRTEGRAVREYLEALEANRPRRGRKRTAETVKRQLATTEKELGSASGVDRLQLVQRRLDLTAELERMTNRLDVPALEREFVKVAKTYGDRKGISYSAWREVGVAPEVLRRAGVTR
jgi:hypothetical protein